jgi:hypothetical protein
VRRRKERERERERRERRSDSQAGRLVVKRQIRKER